MQQINTKIALSSLAKMSDNFGFGFVKAVVDVKQKIMAIDADLHADLEKVLLESGSIQEDLWGINLYPDMPGEDFIEYDSLINIRPRQNNPSRDVLDISVRDNIALVVNGLVDFNE